jgi:hypothetical protein
MTEKESKQFMVTVYSVINMYNSYLEDDELEEDDLYEKLENIASVADDLLVESREKGFVIPRKERYMLYEIMKGIDF